MFFEYFENLRSKPKDVRKRYALGLSSAFTFFVVLIWLTSLFLGSLGSRGTEKETADATKEPETTTTLFEKANSFVDDTSGSGDLLDEEWTEELQTIDGTTQQTQNDMPQSLLQTQNATVTQSTFSQ